MTTDEFWVALIGAAGVILAAWIRSRRRRKRSLRVDMVGRDRIGGDAVSGDKYVSHDHLVIEGPDPERKGAIVYFLEKVFTFGFSLVAFGVVFGLIGYGLANEDGFVAGVALALIVAVVSAGNVKRTKGLV